MRIDMKRRFYMVWPALMILVLVLLIVNTDPSQAQGRRGGRGGGRGDTSPAIGDMAPDFELVTMKSFIEGRPKKVRLSSFRGKDEVVLVLTSYT